jgi:hypothetical protein
LEGDYSERSCLAGALAYLVVVAVGYAGSHGFEYLIHLVPGVRLGPVTIPTRLVKYLVVMPAFVILVWRVYPLYVRWLVRVGWLRKPKSRDAQREDP